MKPRTPQPQQPIATQTTQAPREGTVGAACRRIHATADAFARDPASPAQEAGRAGYLAWASLVVAELLATPEGDCALDGLATASDLVAGAMWIADRQQMVADAIPDKKAPEHTKAMERATFLRALVTALPDVPDVGDARAITRLWTTVTANLVALCTSGRMPPKMQPPYLNELLMWSREATWIAAFELVLQREFQEWLDEVVPTEEPCATCGVQGTATQPNGSHPQAGTVACFTHRLMLPPIDRPPPGDEAPQAVASVVVVELDGRRLYVTRGAGAEFPGGKRQPGETARAAAARELREETGAGCPAEDLNFVAVVSAHDGQPMAVYRVDAEHVRITGNALTGGAWRGPEGDCAFMPDALAADAHRKDYLDAWRGILTALRDAEAAPTASPAPGLRPRAAMIFGEQRRPGRIESNTPGAEVAVDGEPIDGVRAVDYASDPK